MDGGKEELLLAQWQTCVEMANAISQRRDAMNNLFVTLNLVILTAVSVVWNFESLFIMSAGIVLCMLWLLLIRNFGILNKVKFQVINDIEHRLPEQPFGKEWELLTNNKKYSSGAKLEKFLPIIFILLYAIAIIVMVKTKFYSGGVIS